MCVCLGGGEVNTVLKMPFKYSENSSLTIIILQSIIEINLNLARGLNNLYLEDLRQRIFPQQVWIYIIRFYIIHSLSIIFSFFGCRENRGGVKQMFFFRFSLSLID